MIDTLDCKNILITGKRKREKKEIKYIWLKYSRRSSKNSVVNLFSKKIEILNNYCIWGKSLDTCISMLFPPKIINLQIHFEIDTHPPPINTKKVIFLLIKIVFKVKLSMEMYVNMVKI